MMKPQHYQLFSLLFHGINAFPTQDPSGPRKSLPRRDLSVVHTTEHSDGSTIDWIPLTSQVANGSIATAPPLPPFTASFFNQSSFQPWAMLQSEGAETGPEGTVPVLLSNFELPLVKGPPVDPDHMPDFSAEAVGDHWYASSAQYVNNRGGSASFSIYKAWTEWGSDFSLLQSAVIRSNVPKPGDNSQIIRQTVEAGWYVSPPYSRYYVLKVLRINYPNQISPPHLFTFYTTDGYATIANNKGGWNRDVAGWVQVDKQIFPGTTFSPLSTRGGAQYDIKIQWLLDNGNWWLFVLDRWIGYYPASLFGAGTDASRSLQTGANQINFYGEIYDSHPQPTKTDMGSGNWPEAGWQQSAYIRNMVYTDSQGAQQTYDGSRGIVVSDTGRYRMAANWGNTGTWGAHMYLGGPGAGGAMDA
jgi:hypothetical protein